MNSKFYIGTAGWSLPKLLNGAFPREGSHLERYSQVFNAVEINSSFYQDHKYETYLRWRQAVPENFRFSVKLSKKFTHEQRLQVKLSELETSLLPILSLEEKLGYLLVQLPPKLECELRSAEDFFLKLRLLYDGPIALEPRNSTWVQDQLSTFYRDLGLVKVLADPERASQPRWEESFQDTSYARYHGSPIIYRSSYDDKALDNLARRLVSQENWCIFDNTTFGHATLNALSLKQKMGAGY